MALMWFLRASQSSRFPNRNFRGGLGCSELTDTPEPFREDTWQEVTEQGPSCWLTALPRGSGTSWGQSKEQGPTNHPVPARLKAPKVSTRHAEGGKVQPWGPHGGEVSITMDNQAWETACSKNPEAEEGDEAGWATSHLPKQGLSLCKGQLARGCSCALRNSLGAGL